jgi:hypothetical protein
MPTLFKVGLPTGCNLVWVQLAVDGISLVRLKVPSKLDLAIASSRASSVATLKKDPDLRVVNSPQL